MVGDGLIGGKARKEMESESENSSNDARNDYLMTSDILSPTFHYYDEVGYGVRYVYVCIVV
jgi:hypothetical protein